MTSTIQPSDLLSAAKEHDEYLLALDEAKQWWSAEDKLTAVLTGLDDGADSSATLDQTERWQRAAVMFDPQIIVGLRAYLVAEGRALPLPEPAPPRPPEPKPEPAAAPQPLLPARSVPVVPAAASAPPIVAKASAVAPSLPLTRPAAGTVAPPVVTPAEGNGADAAASAPKDSPATGSSWRKRRKKQRAAAESAAAATSALKAKVAAPTASQPAAPTKPMMGTFAGRVAPTAPTTSSPAARTAKNPASKPPILGGAAPAPVPTKPAAPNGNRGAAIAPAKPAAATGIKAPVNPPSGPTDVKAPARPAAAPNTGKAPAAAPNGSKAPAAPTGTKAATAPVRPKAAPPASATAAATRLSTKLDLSTGQPPSTKAKITDLVDDADTATPLRSTQHRKGNFLIGAGAVLLFASLLGALFLRTSGTSETPSTDTASVAAAAATAADPSTDTDNAETPATDAATTIRSSATAPFVTFSSCGPERATGSVENPLATGATIDVMIEFSDGVGQFNPVSLQLDVAAGETASINVPISASSSDASKLQCMAFVRQFEAAN